MESEAWKSKLKTIIPSYGKKLAEEEMLCREVRARSTKILEL
jgi:malate dehydrogenase (quinone)